MTTAQRNHLKRIDKAIGAAFNIHDSVTNDLSHIPPTHPDCPQSLLDAAKKIIEERGKDYGDIQKSFERIAKFWSAYKGVEITPKDVAAMMILLKISRWVTSDKPDTLLDIVGYAECAAKLNKAEA